MRRKATIADFIIVFLLGVLCLVTLYPILYVLFSSISDATLLIGQKGLMLWPKGFSLEAYKIVLSNASIAIGYRNTVFYLVLGTSINMFLTILGAYALSRKDLYIGKAVTIFIVFTMQFNGGLIPTYIIVNKLLGSSIWTQVLPLAIQTVNLLILRTGFSAIPDSLIESARIDGAGDFTILQRMILPLSKSSLAVISLYYGVYYWNSWLPATMYLRDRQLFPLQLFLREIILQNATEETLAGISASYVVDMSEVVKYATIIVAIVPILCVYPFLQKYFVKGVMMGAVKG